MTRFRLAVIALTLLISSSAWADLKTFDVDPQYQQGDLRGAPKDPRPARLSATYGRVELLPSGQILVNASPETLEQVEQVLQAIRTRSVAAARRACDLRYWAVLGTRAQCGAANTIGTTGRRAALNDVLAELRRLHGDLTFRVIGTAAVATNSGQYGEVSGTTLSVEQTAYVQGDTLNAEISMELSSGRRSSAADRSGGIPDWQRRACVRRLRRGEFVVLGESHVQSARHGLEGPVFYIVHWRRVAALVGGRPDMTSVDKAQWIDVYRRLEKPLYNVVYRVIWDATESQDVVQETFLRCWRRKDDIRADGFKALLFRTALNLASNRRRRTRVWRMVGVAALDDVADENASTDALSKPVSEALEALPTTLRDVLLLTELAGMTYPEIATALGIAEGTVGSRRTRALALLRERLDVQRSGFT